MMDAVNKELLRAVEEGDLQTVKKSVQNGADLGVKNKLGEAPLHVAASKGFLDIVQYLVDRGADTFDKDGADMTALHLAARDGQIAVVTYLLSKMDNIPERLLNDVVLVANMSATGKPEIVELLEKYHIKHTGPKPTDEGGADARLVVAANDGNVEGCADAIEAKANPDAVDDRGMTPLLWASVRGHDGVVQLLLDHDADVNKTNDSGWTPLMEACVDGHSDVVKTLLNRGADVNLKTLVSGTAILFAAAGGHLDIVEMLLEQGADPAVEITAPGKDEGMTALSYAQQNAHDAVVKLLREWETKHRS
nr:ankyrin repeat domain-containing protein [Candidatus Sigynarchaeota archaeon]